MKPGNIDKSGKTGSSISAQSTNEVMRVSIQGFEGSFHQVAARQYFGKDVEVIPCATFKEVIKIACNKKDS